MGIDQSILEQIVSDVCVTMLGLATEPGDLTSPPRESLAACIRISGDSDSLVEVIAGERVARAVAAAMFAQEANELAADEVRDAWGELVNIIGGNIKGTLGGDLDLSLPCVGDYDESPHSVGSLRPRTVALTVSGEPLLVRWSAVAPQLASC